MKRNVPQVGDRRIRRVFLWFPWKLPNPGQFGEPWLLTRWMEFAHVVEEYQEHDGTEGEFWRAWMPIAWAPEK